MSDIYQERYLAHQNRKKEMLTPNFKGKHKKHVGSPKFFDVIKARKSVRVFSGEPIPIPTLATLKTMAQFAPSSCDRHGVTTKFVESRQTKSILSGLLVGGVGWIHRADVIILLIGDKNAYKSPNEREFMHYLDAGVLAQHIMLVAEALNVATCFVNPNVNAGISLEDNEIFCGAIALGNHVNSC
jgi:nitroreductase